MPEKTTRCSTRSNTEKIYTKTEPSQFGCKHVHEIENDNLYIVDSAGNQICITDYDSVNQAFQELNYAIIDSIEFSLNPGTGKLIYNSKHSNVEINQVLQAKTWKEAETTILMYHLMTRER